MGAEGREGSVEADDIPVGMEVEGSVKLTTDDSVEAKADDSIEEEREEEEGSTASALESKEIVVVVPGPGKSDEVGHSSVVITAVEELLPKL